MNQWIHEIEYVTYLCTFLSSTCVGATVETDHYGGHGGYGHGGGKGHGHGGYGHGKGHGGHGHGGHHGAAEETEGAGEN